MKFESVRAVLFVCVTCMCLALYAQRDYVYGSIQDTSKISMSDVYVRNTTAGSITSSNEQGVFKIPAMSGDSLLISFIGYEDINVKVDSIWLQKGTSTFTMQPKTTFLDEVTITKFPAYEQFKEQILSTNAVDTTLQVYGVPRVVITREDRLNASLKSRGPISILHNTFSKRAKEQKKLRSVLQNQGNRDLARTKFTRDWVAEHTKLKGDQLTSFIAFCNFSENYLSITPEYVIHEDMMALLPKFLEEIEVEKG